MDVIRQKLAEAGVIGPIVDDFYRIYELEIIYGNKRISLADQVSPSELQHRPDHFEYSYDASYCEYLQRFGHPILIAVASLSLNPYISPLLFPIFFKSCPSVDTQGLGQWKSNFTDQWILQYSYGLGVFSNAVELGYATI